MGGGSLFSRWESLPWKVFPLTKTRSQPPGEGRPAGARCEIHETLQWRHCLSNSHLNLAWRYREKGEMARQAIEKYAEVPPATRSTAEAFMESWDALIPFTGLWPALLPGTFDRLLNLRCPEVQASCPCLTAR